MSYRVAANLVLGADGSTTLGGSSKGLSFPADRLRFHQLRTEFKVILIGGNTARQEPYWVTPLPLIILSHHDLPALLEVNEKAVRWELPLSQAIARAGELYGDTLIEAGPALIKEAVAAGLVTELFITISPDTPAENQIDIKDLTSGAIEVSRESDASAPGSLFLRYRLAPSQK